MRWRDPGGAPGEGDQRDDAAGSEWAVGLHVASWSIG
jgi:hypothetical protein